MLRNRNHTSSVPIIASYAEFLALKPGQDGRRRELIAQVVRECIERYFRLMYKVIRPVVVSHEDAEDVIQDILIRWTLQLDAGKNLPNSAALAAWFRRVAYYAGIAKLRRLRGKRSEAEREAARQRFAQEQRGVLSELALRELPEVIDRLLTVAVEPKARRVFDLWTEGLRYSEIATALQKSVPEVQAEKRYVVARLREELTRIGWSDD